jgi:hypothetical protein
MEKLGSPRHAAEGDPAAGLRYGPLPRPVGTFQAALAERHRCENAYTGHYCRFAVTW